MPGAGRRIRAEAFSTQQSGRIISHISHMALLFIYPHMTFIFLQQSEVVGVRFVARGNSPTIRAASCRVCTTDVSNTRFTLVLAE